MTDGRVLSEERIRQREKDTVLWLECNPDDTRDKFELDLFSTIHDLQHQVSELQITQQPLYSRRLLEQERDDYKATLMLIANHVIREPHSGQLLPTYEAELAEEVLAKHAPRQEDAK